MTDYFDYPQDARDTRQPTSPHLRPFYDCDDCGHQVSQHSSEGGVGCLYVTIVRAGSMQTLVQSLSCPCLRPGTSQADQ